MCSSSVRSVFDLPGNVAMILMFVFSPGRITDPDVRFFTRVNYSNDPDVRFFTRTNDS